MNKNYLALKVKELRLKRGLSQEALAEESGLSRRTIQRIELGESNPNGDSLKRLANALQVNADELIDWAIKEDPRYLTLLNLSALTFVFFPLLGTLIPFILWTSKKDKIKDININAKALINFQIFWTILLFFIPIALFLISRLDVINGISLHTFITITVVLYAYNFLSIVINTVRISSNKSVRYFPKINLLS
jgi:transcriptional regulator with XRE-family HTH domain